VRFLDYLPREELRYSLAAADVSLVTENPAVKGLLLPSKTYGILASGRPILFVGDHNSDVAAIIRSSGCGVVIDPGDPDALAKTILRLRDAPDETDELGRRARCAAEESFSRRRSSLSWIELLASLATPSTGAIAH
jgi:glycosyltransferase involved in cell wall biosynthesis